MPTAALLRRRPVLLVLAALLLTGCARIAGEPFQPTHNAALPLEPGARLGQSFQAPSGAVDGVDLLVATYGVAPDPQSVLRVTLLEAPGGSPLAAVDVPGSAISDNAWVAVTFGGAVPVSDGFAAVEATWDGERPIALRANVPPADHTDDVLLNDPYPGGELLREGQRATGDLAFRVRGAPGPGDVLASLVGLVRGLVGGLVREPLFAVGWSALLLGALVLAVWGLRRRPAAVPQLDERREGEQRHRDREGAADQP